MNPQNISHHLFGIAVQQHVFDGYINASHLCKAHYEKTGELKEPREWLSNNSTKSILEKISEAEKISVDDLVDVKKGRNGGTWIHPRLAVRFAMWLSDDFSLQVEDWVQQWMNWKISPVQLAFSELRELTEIIEVSIKAAQMIHTTVHGLTAILNMARKKFYAIRENQADTFASNDLYYKQVDRVRNKIYAFEEKIYALKSAPLEDLILSPINTIDVESQQMPDFSNEDLSLLQEYYEEIEDEGRLLEAKEEALLKPTISKVMVARGSFGRAFNNLEFQAIREQDDNNITVYIFHWGKQIGCKTFREGDYPYVDNTHSSTKDYRRHNFCNEICKEFFGRYISSALCVDMMHAIEEVMYNNYYCLVHQARNFAELEAAKRFLPDNVPHQSLVRQEH